jgi:hypothetical protein
LRPLEIFYSHLVYFPRFWYFVGTEKNLATLVCVNNPFLPLRRFSPPFPAENEAFN